MSLGNLCSDGDSKEKNHQITGVNEQYNSSTLAFYILVHFFAILCKIEM